MVICMLHLVQGSQDAVPQRVVLMKPHSPKSVQETPVNLVLQGVHGTSRINVSVGISQPYPEIVGAGIIQLQKCDLSIQVAIKGSPLLPILPLSSSTGYGGSH